MDEDDLKRRTKRFAQERRWAPIYRASCRARSKAEFMARLGVVEEKADESEYWMELIIDGGLMKEKLVEPLRIEAHELCAIMTSSRISAAKNKKLARKAIELRKRAIKNQKSPIKNQ